LRHVEALKVKQLNYGSKSPRWFGVCLSSRGFAFVMGVSAAEEWYLVEHVLLEPFEPQVDHWRHKQRNQLGENQTSNDHQTERAARCGVLAEPKRNRYCAHERGKRGHHDGAKSFHAGFVNGRAEVPAFVDSLQGKINNHDPVLLHDA